QVEQVVTPAAEQLLERVSRRFAADPSAPLRVETVAAEADMSRSAFSHLFLRQTGLTPGHYITELRVQHAARLLSAASAPLASIARQCGFADATHLSKVFRRLRQQTPSAYRRSAGLKP